LQKYIKLSYLNPIITDNLTTVFIHRWNNLGTWTSVLWKYCETAWANY